MTDMSVTVNKEVIKNASNMKIEENDTVIIQRGNFLKSCTIKNKSQKLGRPGEGQIQLNLIGAVGHYYGTQLKLNKEKTGKSFNLDLPEDDLSEGLDLVTSRESGFDNRNICDDGQSQLLSKEDIKQLMDSGKTGDEVIQTLVENNKSFKSKTKYSQEKYVSKKQRKYGECVTIHKPSIPNLAHMYYQHDPLRISNLRIDTLSQILSYSNVQPGGNFAVYEAGIHGLVTASMLQRMNSEKALIHVYSGDYPHKDAIEMMQFDESHLKTLSYISSECLPQFNFDDQQSLEQFRQSLSEEKNEDLVNGKKRKLDNEASLSLETQTRKKKFFRSRDQDMRRSVKVFLEGLHGFVVACKQHPSSITLALLSYLKPGHSFVIFSPYKEPLLDLYMDLKNKNCVNLRILENWLRNYQVLPDRTHPEVCMSGGGGYLLTGCKVAE